ncbi:MAG: VWA domain-containing protein [Pseudomonadales bacterium]
MGEGPSLTVRMLSFELPYVFLLLPLPWLVYRFVPPVLQQNAALYTPFYKRLPLAESSSTAKRSLLAVVLLTLCWALLLGAAAKPSWLGEQVNLPASGRNLMLAVDISGSMQVEDMVLNDRRVNRLQVVKEVVGDFVQQRAGDRLGLILFGSQAYLQTPLTFDRNTLHELLLEAQIGFAGEKTAIGDAIGLAIKRLQGNEESSRVLILLTDGANTAGMVPPRQAAQLASEAGVKIYTIGMGADEMVTGGIFGTTFGARRQNPSADLDEDTLRLIADETGGRYYRAKDANELQQIYTELDRLEAIEQESVSYRPRKSLFHFPLGLAAAVLFGWLLLNRARAAYGS